MSPCPYENYHAAPNPPTWRSRCLRGLHRHEPAGGHSHHHGAPCYVSSSSFARADVDISAADISKAPPSPAGDLGAADDLALLALESSRLVCAQRVLKRGCVMVPGAHHRHLMMSAAVPG